MNTRYLAGQDKAEGFMLRLKGKSPDFGKIQDYSPQPYPNQHMEIKPEYQALTNMNSTEMWYMA